MLTWLSWIEKLPSKRGTAGLNPAGSLFANKINILNKTKPYTYILLIKAKNI